MKTLFENSGGTLKVALMGELDESTASEVRSALDEHILNSPGHRLIIDLSALSFMDSTGIGVLVGRYRKFRNDVAFFIADPNATVDKILRLSGIYMIMPRIETA